MRKSRFTRKVVQVSIMCILLVNEAIIPSCLYVFCFDVCRAAPGRTFLKSWISGSRSTRKRSAVHMFPEVPRYPSVVWRKMLIIFFTRMHRHTLPNQLEPKEYLLYHAMYFPRGQTLFTFHASSVNAQTPSTRHRRTIPPALSTSNNCNLNNQAVRPPLPRSDPPSRSSSWKARTKF